MHTNISLTFFNNCTLIIFKDLPIRSMTSKNYRDLPFPHCRTDFFYFYPKLVGTKFNSPKFLVIDVSNFTSSNKKLLE